MLMHQWLARLPGSSTAESHLRRDPDHDTLHVCAHSACTLLTSAYYVRLHTAYTSSACNVMQVRIPLTYA